MFLTYTNMVKAGPFKRYVKRAKIFALAKGFKGRRKNCYTLSIRAVHKALEKQYRSRRLKKRDMRKLWIQRINFGAREHNISYNVFMRNIAYSNIGLNRKIMSEMAIHEPRSFHALAQLAKDRHSDGLLAALD